MKRILIFFVCLILTVSLVLPEAFAKGRGYRGGSTHVRGYTKKRGTYVAPHRKTAPDKSKINNWSSKGNINPYTGKKGTKNPY
ncbi:MAG: hypothetical protein PHT49_04340 [Desulfovibrionales bacterium]|nr:hypothetical protein [Desulfovibrionales bacterium]